MTVEMRASSSSKTPGAACMQLLLAMQRARSTRTSRATRRAYFRIGGGLGGATGGGAMGCAEVKDAIDWAKRTTVSSIQPVTAFLNIHIGETGEPGSPVGTDICIYAYGHVGYVAEPTPHLAGDLPYFGTGVTLTPEMLP